MTALMLACILIPAAGSMAGTRTSRLHRIESQRQQLARELADKSAHANSLRSRIDVLNRAMDHLQVQINDLDRMIARVQSQVKTAQSHIDATRVEISKIQGRARAQAVMLYKDGGTEALDTLLSSKSLVELDNRIELLGVAASQNTAALIRFGRLQERLKAQNQILFSRRNELEQERSAQRRALDTRTELRAQVASDLQRVNGKIRAEKDKERGLADQEKHIKVVIAQAQAKSAVTVMGISSQGFIWPLNAPITSPFGPRWGSVHPGIDLAGYTGEPFVAAKGGRVIYASWMDGYGNATMIDVGGGIVTLYGHQTRLGVSVGENVNQGQIIGYVGCTGFCTGPHLHFEVRVNGTAVDPMRYLP
jgi:murein DD-endopeptidase MepM/ murein hydrolase activator NlpD